MNHWFRVYNSMVDDPKVQRLPGDLVKALLNLWCLASQNDGVLPSTADVAFKLRVNSAKAAEIITKLCRAGLIDNDDGVFRPHNWDNRQYKSDGSTERVKRFRDRKRNVSCNVSSDVSETGPEQSRTDTEQSRAEAPRAVGVSSSEKVLRSDLMEAFGSKCPDLSRAGVWLSKGYASSMVVEVVRELLARKPDIASLAYFDAALAERHANRVETPSERAKVSINMDSVIKLYATTGVWSRYAGPEPGMIGCRAPADLLEKYGLAPDGRKLALAS